MIRERFETVLRLQNLSKDFRGGNFGNNQNEQQTHCLRARHRFD
jgi:hypothetical protein